MCDFKPGDEVVCVDAAFLNEDCPLPRLREGAVYIVASVDQDGEPCDCHGNPVLLDLAGMGAGSGWGYAACCFRKLQRRKTDLSIEAFLTIKPGQFEEPKRPAKTRERA